MQLTKDFSLEEFRAPKRLERIFRDFCADVLQPIRDKLNLPVTITSGYRSPAHNKRVGGAPNSQHVATRFYCAADVTAHTDLEALFDWIRLDSGLPFDQLILERPAWDQAPSIIHISYVKPPRRMALEGLTGGKGKYYTKEVF